MSNPVLELKQIQRVYGRGDNALTVLNGVDLEISAGEVVALTGPSGSGKSTLLHLAGLLDTPTAGQIRIDGIEATNLSDKGRTRLRRDTVGFVYQAHLLLPDFTALENVMMPLMIAGKTTGVARKRAEELLDQLGLSHRLKHRSGQLSGGEQQRVAIARALANRPKLLLADEPTGNLDPITSETVFKTLLALVRQTGLSALIATHNPDLAAQMDRRISVQNGHLVEGSD